MKKKLTQHERDVKTGGLTVLALVLFTVLLASTIIVVTVAGISQLVEPTPITLTH